MHPSRLARIGNQDSSRFNIPSAGGAKTPPVVQPAPAAAVRPATAIVSCQAPIGSTSQATPNLYTSKFVQNRAAAEPKPTSGIHPDRMKMLGSNAPAPSSTIQHKAPAPSPAIHPDRLKMLGSNAPAPSPGIHPDRLKMIGNAPVTQNTFNSNTKSAPAANSNPSRPFNPDRFQTSAAPSRFHTSNVSAPAQQPLSSQPRPVSNPGPAAGSNSGIHPDRLRMMGNAGTPNTIPKPQTPAMPNSFANHVAPQATASVVPPSQYRRFDGSASTPPQPTPAVPNAQPPFQPPAQAPAISHPVEPTSSSSAPASLKITAVFGDSEVQRQVKWEFTVAKSEEPVPQPKVPVSQSNKPISEPKKNPADRWAFSASLSQPPQPHASTVKPPAPTHVATVKPPAQTQSATSSFSGSSQLTDSSWSKPTSSWDAANTVPATAWQPASQTAQSNGPSEPKPQATSQVSNSNVRSLAQTQPASTFSSGPDALWKGAPGSSQSNDSKNPQPQFVKTDPSARWASTSQQSISTTFADNTLASSSFSTVKPGSKTRSTKPYHRSAEDDAFERDLVARLKQSSLSNNSGWDSDGDDDAVNVAVKLQQARKAKMASVLSPSTTTKQINN
uniref:Uncharacterized protein n=1 Tax=Spongospora subterranea TaxID=70186 RepID=A0A0H5R4N1_9EUKA|eukprot:CRZ09098.1 hypothetical protein [Spongospora subterranea]